MSEMRRWLGPVGPPMTDAEVLAEMGGERRWQCRFVTSRNAFSCTQHHSHKGCGWVWIVKEDGDE